MEMIRAPFLVEFCGHPWNYHGDYHGDEETMILNERHTLRMRKSKLCWRASLPHWWSHEDKHARRRIHGQPRLPEYSADAKSTEFVWNSTGFIGIPWKSSGSLCDPNEIRAISLESCGHVQNSFGLQQKYMEFHWNSIRHLQENPVDNGNA